MGWPSRRFTLLKSILALRSLLGSELVEFVGAIHLSFQLGDVAEVIQSKGVGRIEKICLVEQIRGGCVVVLLNGQTPSRLRR